MPFMAQNSMPSSLTEPQPARATAAAATTPAAAPLTNLHSTGTRPQSHSRRSRSRRRRHRHSHSHTSHHRGHDKAPRRHTTRRAQLQPVTFPLTAPPPPQAIAPQPYLPLTLPPTQVLPTTLPRTHDQGSTSSPAHPHLPRFHCLEHFRMGHRQVSKVPLHAGGTNHGDTNRRATMQTAGASMVGNRKPDPAQLPITLSCMFTAPPGSNAPHVL